MKKVLTIIGLSVLAVSAFSQTKAAPSSYKQLSQATVIGNLKSVIYADGNLLMVMPQSQKPIMTEFSGFLSPLSGSQPAADSDFSGSAAGSVFRTPQTLNVSIKAMAASAGAVGFEVYLLNWSTGQYVPVVSELRKPGDFKGTIAVKNSGYVNNKTGEVRTMVVWHQLSRTKAIGVDAIEWSYGK